MQIRTSRVTHISDTDDGRDGGWRKHCESCKMFNWYDVEEKVNGIR